MKKPLCLLFGSLLYLNAGSILAQQSLDRHLYYQVAPNLSFGKITVNHEKIKSRQAFVPFFGIGVGYFFPVRERLFLDASFDLHGTYYRINSLPSPTGSSGFSPMMRISLNRFFYNETGKFALVPQAGAALAYSFEEQESVTVTDTLTGNEFEALQARTDGFTFFANAGLGVFVRMAKRNVLVSLVYSQGLQHTYSLDMLYRESTGTYRSQFMARDSYLSLQLKIFLKNRTAPAATPVMD